MKRFSVRYKIYAVYDCSENLKYAKNKIKYISVLQNHSINPNEINQRKSKKTNYIKHRS